MKVTLPKVYPGMLNDVPEEDRPRGEEEVRFWQVVARELITMMLYAEKATDPQVVLNDMRQAGSQYIWEFYVNDLAIPQSDIRNLHGQNISQWQYAGCVLLSNGKVSTHH